MIQKDSMIKLARLLMIKCHKKVSHIIQEGAIKDIKTRMINHQEIDREVEKRILITNQYLQSIQV